MLPQGLWMFNFNSYKNVTAGYVLIQSVWKAFKIRGIKMSNTCIFINTSYKIQPAYRGEL